MKKIMFVCTGNICRSAMAHQYMQKKVKDLGIENDYLISSCGVYATNGDRSTKNAKDVMSEYNVSLEYHVATNICDSDIQDYDLIICMSNSHKIAVLQLYPKLEGKVFTLKEYVNDNVEYKDVDDPWGLDLKVYEQCAEEIVENVDKLIEKF